MTTRTEKLTATVTHVGPYGIQAERHWGGSDPAGTRFVYIHELHSPGITRHAVGDTIRVAYAYVGLGPMRPVEAAADVDN